MRENGYEKMPPIEETLANYLSLGEASSLKAPSLPTKPLQRTSCLNGRAYVAAGQAVASLHTMAVLQAYQADLLKDLDKGQGLSPDEVAELHRTTDLALRATKQAATAMGRSMAAMVVMERHLWVNLADLGKKEKGFLLDAPFRPLSFLVLPSRRDEKTSFLEGPGLSPNIKGVLARPGLRIGDGLRRLVLRPVPLLRLRVVPGDGVGRGEVVKT
ncbi:Lamina-associated polypeptide 2, isoform alpha [Labeo rohita]|uniref:Lamina-associated polypeptide 2, isoform alpha n=1 Tax=Labeo rohita TaxID=84645 RepID=A0ABQ8L6C0_LABRO|nr:Lamina-associated polypeptide 2, isoform alpha [Labeo rohita]